MSPKVPEELSAEQQLAILRDWLMNHNQAFGHMRGKLGGSTMDLLGRLLETRSPSAALEAYNALVSDMRIMFKHLAKLRRDGHTVAEAELMRALTQPGYLITGETVPLESTAPYTLFMIDPELTFATAKFLEDWKNVYLNQCPRVRCRAVVEPEFALDRYGNLIWEVYLREMRENYYDRIGFLNDDLQRAQTLVSYVLETFGRRLEISTKRVGTKTTDFIPMGWRTRQAPRTRAQLTANHRVVNMLSCVFGKPLEQGQVLSAFPRAEQHRVATWQFHAPAAMNLSSPRRTFYVGFHPRAEHEKWQRARPQLTSRGTANGWGAIIIPRSMLDMYDREGHFLFHNRNLDFPES